MNGNGDFELVFKYTIEDAERDGIAVRNMFAEADLISHVTRGVFDLFTRELGPVIDVTPLAAALEIAARKIRAALRERPREWLVTMKIAGEDVWACLNELGRWTLLLPSEY